MYVKEACIVNLGVIKSAEINFQLDDTGNPKPIMLVGPNGSGKTLFLASIVNSIVEIINSLHSENYQFMSFDYIRDDSDYMWRQIEFTTNHFFHSLILHSPKTNESSFQFHNEIIQKTYDDMAEGEVQHSKNYLDSSGSSGHSIQPTFFNNCILYLPVNRFEHPLWLTQQWELHCVWKISIDTNDKWEEYSK